MGKPAASGSTGATAEDKGSAAGAPEGKVSITGGRAKNMRPSFTERMAKAATASGIDPKTIDVDPATIAPDGADDSGDDGSDDSVDPNVEDKKVTSKKPEGTKLTFSGTELEKLAIADALKNADLKSIALAVGVDPKLVDTADEKFAVQRRKQKKIDDGIAHITSESTRLTKLGENLKEEFGEPREFKRLYKAGKYSSAAAALQKWTGDDFGTITRNIARETAGLSPEEKAGLEKQARLEQENAELRAKQKKAETQQTEAQKRTTALQTVSTKCAGHDVLKLKNGSALVLAALEDSYDDTTQSFKLTFKQAADRVLEEKMDEAKSLGLTKAEKEQKKKDEEEVRTKKEEPSPGVRGFTKRKSFDERMEAARRLTAKSLR